MYIITGAYTYMYIITGAYTYMYIITGAHNNWCIHLHVHTLLYTFCTCIHLRTRKLLYFLSLLSSQQRESVDHVMRDMKKLRLLPQSWCLARADGPLSPPALSPPPAPPVVHSSPLPMSHKRGLSLRHLSDSSDEDEVPGSHVGPPPQRSSLPRVRHMREFLCGIETTPVRTVRAGEGGREGPLGQSR